MANTSASNSMASRRANSTPRTKTCRRAKSGMSRSANPNARKRATSACKSRSEHISVELDGQPASEFDASNKNLPPRKIWYEPKREPKRPQAGYIGLQIHEPGDIVWFKEISVRPLPKN